MKPRGEVSYMHILIIAPEQIPVPPPVGGSVEHCIYQIAKKISPKHTVTIISRLRANYPKKSRLGHITIIRVPGANKQAYLSNVLKTVKGHRYDRIQIDNRPRFVHAVRKVFPHTPISVFLHSKTFISPPMTSKKQAASDLSGANRIIGNSLSLQNHLKRNFPKIRHKVRYVHLGVDLTQFRPRKEKKHSTGRSPSICHSICRQVDSEERNPRTNESYKDRYKVHPFSKASHCRRDWKAKLQEILETT